MGENHSVSITEGNETGCVGDESVVLWLLKFHVFLRGQVKAGKTT